MGKNQNQLLAFELSPAARAQLDQLVDLLQARPDAPEYGRPTLRSVGSEAMRLGLAALAEKHGLGTEPRT